LKILFSFINLIFSFLSELGSRHDLIQLKEENKILEEVTYNVRIIFFLLIYIYIKEYLQLEFVLLRKVIIRNDQNKQFSFFFLFIVT
jgi:hypothetical protein